MKKKSTIWVMFLLAICILTACNSAGDKSKKEDMPAQTQEVEENNEQASNESVEQLKSEQEAMDYLEEELIRQKVLVEGTALVAEGEEMKDGVKQWFFAWGNNTAEKFTAERRFSVDESGQIWEYDAVSDEWKLMSIPYKE